MPNFFLSHKRAKVAGRVAFSWRRCRRLRRPGFGANAPRSGPRTAGISDEVAARTKSENALGGRVTGAMAMKLFTGCVISAGLVLNVPAANAAVLAPYESGRT